jgi:hypothetical protein
LLSTNSSILNIRNSTGRYFKPNKKTHNRVVIFLV